MSDKESTSNLPTSIYMHILQTNSEPILFESKNWFVLFAKQPCKEGHLLIIPKIQTPKFYDLPLDILSEGFKIATLISRVLNHIYQPPQVALFIKGFTNDDHAHIHVCPVYTSDDINRDPSRPELALGQMTKLLLKLKPEIHKALSSIATADSELDSPDTTT